MNFYYVFVLFHFFSLSFFFSLVNIVSTHPSEIEIVRADVFLYILAVEYSLFHSGHVAYANIFNLSSTRKSRAKKIFFCESCTDSE